MPNNMKQIKAHIAVALDGFIATSDNELDWITSNVKSLIGKEYEAATCLLMGANTYTYLFEHWGGWLYKSKRTFVVSHHDANVTPDCGVEFLIDAPLRKVHEMLSDNDILSRKKKKRKLDSLTLYTIPVMLGKGISFIGETFGSNWHLESSKIIDNNILLSSYKYVNAR